MKLYLETSVWSYLLADHMPRERDATRRLIESAPGRHDLFVSPLVLDELNATRDETRRRTLLEKLNDAQPSKLPENDAIEAVSSKIIELGILTERSEDDAIHIAYSVVHEMDALVSWDTGHIVRLKTRRGVSAVCRLLGYREVELVTPEEL